MFFSLIEIENPEISQYRRVTLMVYTGLGQTPGKIFFPFLFFLKY